MTATTGPTTALSTATTRLTAVAPTPTRVIRAVEERLDALERDVRAAREALAVAEAELLAARHAHRGLGHLRAALSPTHPELSDPEDTHVTR